VGYFAIGWDALAGHAKAPGTICTPLLGCLSVNRGHHEPSSARKKITLYFCPAKRPLSTAYAPTAMHTEMRAIKQMKKISKYKMLSMP